jgi:hypothetical protein
MMRLLPSVLVIWSLALMSCAPGAVFRDGDRFQLPYVGMDKPAADHLGTLTAGERVTRSRCLRKSKPDRDEPGARTLLDGVIRETLDGTGSVALKDVVVTVLGASWRCPEMEARLEATPLRPRR